MSQPAKATREVGVTVDELSAFYPRLYHMAELGSWPSIRRHGLLSTKSLLSLFEIGGTARKEILTAHRPRSCPIEHPAYGRAVVRDQIPMLDSDLRRCLRDGLKPEEWYQILNEKVFFWVTEGRLGKLLGARAYRQRAHTVLVLDSASLLRDYARHVVLSPMNSGATRPFAHPRGADTFLPIARYPFKERRKTSGRNAVVELAVEGGVYDVERYALEVRNRTADHTGEIVWTRKGPGSRLAKPSQEPS